MTFDAPTSWAPLFANTIGVTEGEEKSHQAPIFVFDKTEPKALEVESEEEKKDEKEEPTAAPMPPPPVFSFAFPSNEILSLSPFAGHSPTIAVPVGSESSSDSIGFSFPANFSFSPSSGLTTFTDPVLPSPVPPHTASTYSTVLSSSTPFTFSPSNDDPTLSVWSGDAFSANETTYYSPSFPDFRIGPSSPSPPSSSFQ